MNKWRINVSLDGHLYFRVECENETEAKTVYLDLRQRYQDTDSRFKVTVSVWKTHGESLHW